MNSILYVQQKYEEWSHKASNNNNNNNHIHLNNVVKVLFNKNIKTIMKKIHETLEDGKESQAHRLA